MRFFKLFIFCFALMGFSEEEFLVLYKEPIAILKNLDIRVVAPAGRIKDPETLVNLRIVSKKYLPGIGIDKLKISDASLFHSASDKERFEDLRDALNDESSVVWCFRGGYGSAKLIDYLKKIPKPSREKIFVGYSDITALHLFFSQEWGWKTIHGPVINELVYWKKSGDAKKRPNDIAQTAKICAGKIKKSYIKGIKPLNEGASRNLSPVGKLTGGNLTMVQSSIGTDWEIKTEGRILFLEDINCEPYQIDRILLHLKQAGIFSKPVAIIFGDFAYQGSDKDFSKKIERVLKEFAESTDIPVFKSQRFGHGEINEPIIYNSEGSIKKSSKGLFDLEMKI